VRLIDKVGRLRQEFQLFGYYKGKVLVIDKVGRLRQEFQLFGYLKEKVVVN
jgi:hypothetical protein